MSVRTLKLAVAMATLAALPLAVSQAQVQQQQQQQQQRGTLATTSLAANLTVDDVVMADTTMLTLSPTAKATFSLLHATKELCYDLEFGVMSDSVVASIHKAPKGENGPLVVSLEPLRDTTRVRDTTQVRDMNAKGCVIVRDETIFDDIVANPDQYYVQVSNPKWRKGAIRGQLGKPPLPF